MKITPRNGLVTVRFLEPRKDTMVGKIYVPPTGGNQFKMAEVVEVGRGSPDFGVLVGTDDLRPGQTVLVKAGTQIEIGQTVHNYISLKDEEGHDLAVLNQQDIMAIIEDAPDEAGLELAGGAKADNNEGENNGTD